MMEVKSPYNREDDELNTEAYACNCVCNAQLENNNRGIWASRLTFNKVCGCSCNSSTANKDANHNTDKTR